MRKTRVLRKRTILVSTGEEPEAKKVKTNVVQNLSGTALGVPSLTPESSSTASSSSSSSSGTALSAPSPVPGSNNAASSSSSSSGLPLGALLPVPESSNVTVSSLQETETIDFSNAKEIFPDIIIKTKDNVRLSFLRFFIKQSDVLAASLEGEKNERITEITISFGKLVVNALLNWLIRVPAKTMLTWFQRECNTRRGAETDLPKNKTGYIDWLLDVGLTAYQYNVEPLLSAVISEVQKFASNSNTHPPEYVNEWYRVIKKPISSLVKLLMSAHYAADNEMPLYFANECLTLFARTEECRGLYELGSGYHLMRALISVPKLDDKKIDNLVESLLCAEQSRYTIPHLTKNISNQTIKHVNFEYFKNKMLKRLIQLIEDGFNVYGFRYSRSIKHIIGKGTIYGREPGTP